MNFFKALYTAIMNLFARQDKPVIDAPSCKVLFILKYRDSNYGTYSYGGLSSGLFNSARMVSEALNKYGLGDGPCEAKLVQVTDNNDIDREVFNFKPDIVIIEAIWVVPEKFDVLTKLHPKVKWIIRNHSNIPFLAQEGQAMEWIKQYVTKTNVYVATNTKASLHDLRDIVMQDQDVDGGGISICNQKVLYFPNFYISTLEPSWSYTNDPSVLNVGCFGAIRPLKNHLEQAVASIRLARELKRHLYFHINAGREESGGSPILKNLRALFANCNGASLVEHSWVPHNDFIKIIASMDISIQVSFSETFNIVTADAVQQGVPIVGSPDVLWIPERYKASPTNAHDIAFKMAIALEDSAEGKYSDINRDSLEKYNDESYDSICNVIRLI